MRLKYKVIDRFKGKYPISKINKDSWLELQIFLCQQKSRYTYGYRRVTKWIDKCTGKKINHKKVLRVMRKTNMFAKIRRSRPFLRYLKAVYKYQNLLNQEFYQQDKNKIWVTYITLIHNRGLLYVLGNGFMG